MKWQWAADELVEHWTLHPGDLALLANKMPATLSWPFTPSGVIFWQSGRQSARI